MKPQQESTENFSSTFSSYSPTIINVLLRAYSISDQPGDAYAYPLRPFTKMILTEDAVRYFLFMKEKSKAHRVSFLLQDKNGRLAAFIIQFSNLNQSVLNQLVLQAKMISENDFLKNTTLRALLKKLYNNIHCLLISSSSDYAELKISIVEAYANKVQLDLMSLPSLSPDIILAQHIVTMLLHGKTMSMKIDDMILQHQTQCAEFLLATIHSQQDKTAQEHLLVILKYVALNFQRKQYPISKNILQMDKQVKNKIYVLTLDALKPYLYLQDMVFLSQLILESSTPQKLAIQLKNIRETHCKQMKAWEYDVQQKISVKHTSWNTYLRHQGLQAKDFIYHHSLIGLGAELFQWIGKLLLNTSNHLSESTKKIVLNLFKFSGIVLALFYIYMAGLFYIVRSLVTNQLAHQGYQRFSENRVDDHRAIIIQQHLPFNMQLSLSGYFRVIILTTTLLETMYWQNIEPGILTTSGLSASFFITKFAQYFIESLRIAPNQLPTEDQGFTLFLLASVGYDLGQTSASIFLNQCNMIYEKHLSRLAVITELQRQEQEGILSDLTVASPNLLTPSSLWFTTDNPLKIEWRNPQSGFFYHAECDIQSSPLGFVHEVNCDQIITSSPRVELRPKYH